MDWRLLADIYITLDYWSTVMIVFHVTDISVQTYFNAKIKCNTNLMQHCAGFISAGSLYMFRAQAPIIGSI
jgi:hypothetical protein